MKRFMSISFPYLVTDWWTNRQPFLKTFPVVITARSHGRIVISAVNHLAEKENIHPGMVLADARALVPGLHVIDEKTSLRGRLLKKITEWCIRYTPVNCVDEPDGIILDITGCSHLWGGEQIYFETIVCRLSQFGYTVRAAIADTVGTAWAVARYGRQQIVESAKEADALKMLPPEALRLDQESIDRLYKLGLNKVGSFIDFPRRVLSRRFGDMITQRINQALGNKEEMIEPVKPPQLYSKRLPCLEPIITVTGIEIALEKLIVKLSEQLKSEQKGLRKCVFSCYRSDSKIEKIEIGTNGPTSNADHIKKLFNEKISNLAPGPGIELFILEAPCVEPHLSEQTGFWKTTASLEDRRISELVDRLTVRMGSSSVHRYVADEHFWPERSFKEAADMNEISNVEWTTDNVRPVYIFKEPQNIEVTAPVPDYPPMLFRYNGKLHKISKADGPERIEQEWWIEEGEHRDYYYVEDEEGCRYWIFRSGHYERKKPAGWFLHGLFA